MPKICKNSEMVGCSGELAWKVEDREKMRDSNMELLRIVAMAMIVFGHFIVHGIWKGTEFISRADVVNPIGNYTQTIIYGFFVVGVNMFVLISGYYRIHLKLKSFLAYCLMCIFYNAVFCAVGGIFLDTFSLKSILKVFIVSKTPNWFFQAYFWLLLLSPLLNKALESFGRRQLRLSVLIFALLNCVSGFLFKNGNDTGYCALQLIFVYVLGFWIRRDEAMLRFGKTTEMLCYVFGSFFLGMIGIFWLKFTDISTFWLFRYNNPLIVFTSISLFLFFRDIDLKSRAVNLVASTVVGALFLQGIASHWLYRYARELHTEWGGGIRWYGMFVLITIGIFLLAFVVEYARKKLEKPLLNRLIKKDYQFEDFA